MIRQDPGVKLFREVKHDPAVIRTVRVETIKKYDKKISVTELTYG